MIELKPWIVRPLCDKSHRFSCDYSMFINAVRWQESVEDIMNYVMVFFKSYCWVLAYLGRLKITIADVKVWSTSHMLLD